MDDISLSFKLYSPHCGHDETYKFHLTQDSMEIIHHPKSAKCTWRDGLDPEWSGYSLKEILKCDSIYPPVDLEDCVRYAWVAWREGDLSNSEVNDELLAVANWINATTKAKPKTEFWRKYF